VDGQNVRAIGARARMIRARRGLSLEVVAGLAGISTSYLSMLERGCAGSTGAACSTTSPRRWAAPWRI
jgi:cytoskeletal protein RodZ